MGNPGISGKSRILKLKMAPWGTWPLHAPFAFLLDPNDGGKATISFECTRTAQHSTAQHSTARQGSFWKSREIEAEMSPNRVKKAVLEPVSGHQETAMTPFVRKICDTLRMNWPEIG